MNEFERTEALTESEWDQVFERIKEDVTFGDFTAIHEMLDRLPPRILIGYAGDASL